MRFICSELIFYVSWKTNYMYWNLPFKNKECFVLNEHIPVCTAYMYMYLWIQSLLFLLHHWNGILPYFILSLPIVSFSNTCISRDGCGVLLNNPACRILDTCIFVLWQFTLFYNSTEGVSISGPFSQKVTAGVR